MIGTNGTVDNDESVSPQPDVVRVAVVPRRRSAVNPARHRAGDVAEPVDLCCVAAVYRAARVSSDRRERRAPVAAVARSLGVHRTHAARFVWLARDLGLLEPVLAADRYRR